MIDDLRVDSPFTSARSFASGSSNDDEYSPSSRTNELSGGSDLERQDLLRQVRRYANLVILDLYKYTSSRNLTTSGKEQKSFCVET